MGSLPPDHPLLLKFRPTRTRVALRPTANWNISRRSTARLDKQTDKSRLKLQFELYRDSTRIFQSPERVVRAQSGEQQWVDCGGSFLLKNFSAGDYLLRLMVRDELREGKDAVVDQWIDFTVK